LVSESNARAESFRGSDRHAAMNAVAHVIFNRVGAAGFAKTLHEVIYGKNQFSSMSVCTDPEYNEASRATLLQRLWQHKLKKCVARCAWRRSRERRD
jgi:hypothetical protein